MKKMISILLTAAFAISAADAPRVSRTLMITVEKSLDDKILHMWNDPYALVGPTRGVYLPDFGVVLTAEMNLASANVSMMSPTLSEADKVALHKKKVDRMPQLRKALKEALVAVAASLDPVPTTEKVAIALVLPRYSWEAATGVPMQMMVEGTRAQLLTVKTGSASVDQVVKITESN
jgi:hypothetical protein